MNSILKDIGDRLRQYLKIKGLGVNEFAKSAQTSGAQISNILSGKNYGMTKLMGILAACPELNIVWLLKGEGAMFNMSNDLNHSSSFNDTNKDINIEELMKHNEKLQNEIDNILQQNKSLEGAISYQNITIEAYKSAFEIASSTNRDLKEIIKFYKSVAENPTKARKIA